MLNITPKQTDFNELPDVLKTIYKKGWSRQGKDTALEMTTSEEFACPTDLWTYGQSILDAIDEHFK